MTRMKAIGGLEKNVRGLNVCNKTVSRTMSAVRRAKISDSRSSSFDLVTALVPSNSAGKDLFPLQLSPRRSEEKEIIIHLRRSATSPDKAFARDDKPRGSQTWSVMAVDGRVAAEEGTGHPGDIYTD